MFRGSLGKKSGTLIWGLAVGWLGITGSAAAADEAPLFASDEPLKLVIDAPLTTIMRTASRNMDVHEATLTQTLADGSTQTHAIKINARGLSRRNPDVCRFPPLRVDFKKKAVGGTVFEGQNRLKLVTHCQTSTRFQQYYLQEYAIYRAYMALTPISFRVRMAEITYIDNEGRRKPITRYGFFIEDVDDLAERNSLEEKSIPKVRSSRLDPGLTARYVLFQFMIGNLDWSSIRGPDPEECCHNTKLLGVPGETGGVIWPVPYDFDISGIISAPYAMPPEGLPVKSVKKRLYRGYCRHNVGIPEAIALFREKKPDILAAFENTAQLNDRTRRKSIKYVESFYEILDDPKKIERQIIKKCRGKAS